ncbi:MAG TPA: M56 family metallopeptidase [Solirubrobacterales bacterium]|jgi:Zn-dependent protease with chaperone function
MDRAARNLLALAAIVLTPAAYGLCAFIAFGVVPLLGGRSDAGVGLVAVGCLGALLALSTGRGVRALWRAAAATRELARRIDAAAIPSPPSLILAARETGLAGRVTLIDAPDPCSFVYGASAPRVAISSGLLARLSPAELRAALEHERYHVRHLDPLRSALAAAAVEAVFFLPSLRALHDRYEAARELAADRDSIDACGPRPLAGALMKAIDGTGTERPAAIPLAAPGLIESRLDQLETGREPRLARTSRRNLCLSALGAGAFLVLLVASPLAVADLGPQALLEGLVWCPSF